MPADEPTDPKSGPDLEADDPLAAELRGYVAVDDPESDARAETLVERLRQTYARSAADGPSVPRPAGGPRPMPEWLECFRLDRELGRGGMGTVFAAVDTRLNRSVAVKVLRADLARDPEFNERFLREARTAAAVDHPNVVPIHYVGQAAGGPFLVMPLLQGESLEAWLKGRTQPPPIRTCIRIARQIAAGLDAFHRQGLIHRDVKPSNLWIAPGADADDVRVKILDFGLARAAGGDPPLTEAGTILGTPAFMAPEQARGAAVDHRADLFSLGCVLYQLITLKRAFDGPDALATLASLAVDRPAGPALLNRDCPEPLARLTMELLAKEPAGRPADVHQVIQRLAAVEARPTRSGPRRRVAAGLMLLAAVLAAGTVYVATDKGMIAVETDDPDAKIILEDGGGRITILDPATKRSWRIDTGTYTARVDGDDREIDLPSPFRVKRGDRILATVRKVAPAVTADPDADRAAAERMLLVGGTVTVEMDTGARIVERLRDLPPNRFHLLEVNFFGNKQVKDADLAALKPARRLWNVNLSHTAVSDDGLKHLVGLPALVLLSLDGSAVTNAGLPTLAACPALKDLGLSYSKVTEAGLVHVKRMTRLEGLGLCGLGITDDGLADLRGMKNLRHLGLDQCPVTDRGLDHLKALPLKKLGLVTTKVTADGARRLATVLPGCAIALDDGVLPPTAPPGPKEK
jgi:eukaryotic-like serine/threonine-protein kinase